jgi:hypothetical protein
LLFLGAPATACSIGSDDPAPDDGPAAEGALTAADLASRGAKQVHFAIEGRPDELCIVSKKDAGGLYSDSDEKAEESLCGLNFHAAAPGTGAALCPKDSSTNPSVDVHALEGRSKEDVEASGCTTSELAKFKQSVTCSYTGSILGYYHLSRLLGGAASVPPAVVRTMDLEAHRALVARGIAATAKSDGPGFDVHDAWLQFQTMDASPRTFDRFADVYTADGQQLYGAMQADVTQDLPHPFMRTAGGDAGLQQFSKSATFAVLASPEPLATRFGTGFDAKSVQGDVLAKDASDMILMDELMSQADRYGNIRSLAYEVFEEGGRLKKVKLKRDEHSGAPIDRPDIQGVVIEELVLRDNDCGVTKENRNAKVGLVAKLAHMSAATYSHFQWFAKAIAAPGSPLDAFMREEALLTTIDMRVLSRQATALATTLRARCDSGALALDADLEPHLRGATRSLGREGCASAEPPHAIAGSGGSEAGPIDSHGIELVKR